MIKRLRLRFILAALITVLVVLSAAIASINIYNYSGLQKEARSSLVMVINQEVGYADPEPYSYGPMNPGGGWTWPGMENYETLMREHYFVVSFDENDNPLT